MKRINISMKKEAYEFLRNLKARDKSYSDVILSFKKEQSSILMFFGVLKDLDWDEKERRMKSLRSSFAERLR